MTFPKVLILLCLLIFLVSCAPTSSSTFNTTNSPIVNTSFPGLSDLLELASADDKPLNIIVLHGMAYGDPNLSRETDVRTDSSRSLYGNNITNRLNAILSGFGTTQSAQYLETQNIDRLLIHKYTATINPTPDLTSQSNQGKTVNFHFLNYTGYFAFPDYPNPLRNPYTNSLLQDKVDLLTNDARITKNGASLNVKLKNELVSWGFADVITYLDIVKRDRINQQIISYLNQLYTTQHDGVYAFITQSLGGKVLLDSLIKLYSLEEANTYKNDNINILHSTRAIYMMSNQLPLLDLGTELSNSQIMFDNNGNINVTPTWHTLFTGNGFTKYKPPSEMFIVAFSDPSDILTYSVESTMSAMSSTMSNRTNRTSTNITAVDVLVSLTSPVFGISDPLTAHTGHFENETVIDLLVNGNN